MSILAIQAAKQIYRHLILMISINTLPISALTLIACFFAFSLPACSTFHYQQSQAKALDKYLIITGEAKNFADHRLDSLRRYSASMNGFIKSHGLPNMTYEYQHNDKDGIMLFYISQNVVFSFMEDTHDPDSRYLVEHRPLKDKEVGAYIFLTTGHLPNYNLSATHNSI